MKQLINIFSFVLVFQLSVNGQGLAPGECGIRFSYDATGSLIKREFICNNSGSTIYRTAAESKSKSDSTSPRLEKNETADQIVKVNAIMPNPTTGKFTVTLSSPIHDGKVLLLDANGRAIENKKLSGSTLTFDISSRPAGLYFVRIEFEGKVFTFKIIKE